MVRIYADFNAMESSETDESLARIDLHRRGSLQDLCRLRVRLTQGMQLTVHQDSDDTHDIEASGRARFDSVVQRWFVEFAPRDIRDVPSSPQRSDFPCFGCGADLLPKIEADGLSVGDVCRRCGTRIHLPLEPPPR